MSTSYYYTDANGTQHTVPTDQLTLHNDGNWYDDQGHLCQPTGSGPDGVVQGTSGNDLIDTHYTGDPQGDMIDHSDAILPGTSGNDDVVMAGAGNDSVYANLGNDVVHGGSGDDWLYGGTGNDTLYGDTGNDHLYGGDGNDALYGGDGNDVIYAGSGDDSLHGGAGNDTLVAGDPNSCETANDMMVGGSGNDVFIGGAGNDSMYGGTGSDSFHNLHAGDFVDGGEAACGGADNGPEDRDTLDLTGAGPFHVVYDPHNSENGTVNFLDHEGNITGSMEFHNIECVIPCFTPGMLIATPKGERLVEDLRPGDKVITRDNGIQEIRWIGSRPLDGRMLAANPHLQPILIRQGSLGEGLPERDMLVSPNHRVLVANDRTALYFDEHEVLVAAKHLVNHRGVHEVSAIGVTYMHFMFDRHEVVLSNGAWTESFQPGDYTLKGMGNAQRNELFELFPELRTLEGVEGFTAARKTLKRHEAMLLGR